MKIVLVLLMCSTSAFAARVARWVNEYDKPLSFQCKTHQSIGSVISRHDDGYEDRVWDFSCKNTFSRPASCSWSGYVNFFDELLDYTCPSGSVLSGMSSYHNNKKEDRRWRFLCCRGNINIGRNCKWTGYVNNFDEYFIWRASSGQYLVGAASYHDNRKEDRRWKFYTCEK